MQLNLAKFEFNGGTGFLLKPWVMMRESTGGGVFNPFTQSKLEDIVPARVSIKVREGGSEGERGERKGEREEREIGREGGRKGKEGRREGKGTEGRRRKREGMGGEREMDEMEGRNGIL